LAYINPRKTGFPWFHFIDATNLILGYNVDLSFRALTKFESGDYTGARESLMLVPGASLNDVHKHASSLHLCWDPRSVLEACDKRFTAAQIAAAEGKEPL
jgi:hypothetical protein